MPALFGIVKKTPARAAGAELARMQQTLMHEKFYVTATYQNEPLGVYAGCVNHPQSVCTSKPLVDEARQRYLLFVGEHFPDDAHDRTTVDSVLRAYDRAWSSSLKQLNGWFAGLLVDVPLRRVLLFNDRYGFSRLYYHENEEELVFASEAKAILAIRPALRKIDQARLAELITFDTVLNDKSLFPGIEIIPAGSSWSIQSGSITKTQYFTPREWEELPAQPPARIESLLKEAFTRVLPRYMAGRQRAAISLTAGLDTRLIMAGLSGKLPEVPCYTFGGQSRETLDIRIARRIAALAGREYRTFCLGSDFFEQFPALAEKTVYISEGSHDVCGSHDIYLNRMARQIAPVRVTGRFGSEILRNRRMMPLFRFDSRLFSNEMVRDLDAAHASYSPKVNGHGGLSFALFKELPWHEHGRLNIELSQLQLRTPYTDNEIVPLVYQAPLETRRTSDLQLRLIRSYGPSFAKFATNRGIGGNHSALKSAALRAAGMASVKLEYVYLNRLPNSLARLDYMLDGLRPDRYVAGLQKFEHYRLWFRRHFREFIGDTLLSTQALTRDYVRPAELSKVVSRHLSGRTNHFWEVNKLLTAELLHRVLLEPGGTTNVAGEHYEP